MASRKATTLYSKLSVPTSASSKEIKAAFRKLALSNHPDVGGCKDVFGEIKDAYHVLIDVDQRAEYDRVLGVRTAADKLYRETQEAANAAATGRGPFGGGGTGHWRRPPPPPGQQQQQEQQQQQQRDRSFRIFRDPPKPDGHVEYKPLRHDVQVPLSRFDIRRPENDPDMRSYPATFPASILAMHRERAKTAKPRPQMTRAQMYYHKNKFKGDPFR